ncbi:MAG: SpoIIE family protein phosphatase, partial [Bacteroidota bacterium]
FIPSVLLYAMAGAHALAIFFNYLRWYNISRMIESVVPSGIIYIIACLVFDTRPNEKVSTLYMINISFFILPFIFFSLKEKFFILIGIAFSIFYVVSFDWMNGMIHLDKSHELFYSKGFEFLNYFVAAIVLIIGLVYLKYTNDTYQEKIEKLLKETQEKNVKIMQQKEELEAQKDEIEAQRDQLAVKNEEIIQQKEEIEAQRDEITAQRDFVMKQGDKIANQNEKIKEHRDFLIRQKKEITDSIHYAKRIQNAILPPEEYVNKNLPEHFILFKPRDIVSGDFYWAHEMGDRLIVAAVDCTGHGVPGAFMSLLGVAFLNEIVGKKLVTTAGSILDELRRGIINSLHQTGKEGGSQDGMDIALCIINLKEKEFEFAGANNPLIIVRYNQGKPVLEEIKGDKMPIGYHILNRPFSSHYGILNSGDQIYMFSDGFADQFGGQSGRKFKSRTFKNLLLENHSKPMDVQKSILDQTFKEWKGNFDQVDDIVVIGIRI